MFPKFTLALAATRKTINTTIVRNIGITSVILNKTDPIQQIFLDKSREYYKKKAASKTGLIDSSPETQKALKDEVEKINKQFGSSANAEFPSFKFSDSKLDPVNADQLNIQK